MPKKYEDSTSKALAKARELKRAGKTQAAKSALRAARNKSVDDSYTQPKRARMPDSLVVLKAKRPDDAVGGPNARKYKKMKGK